MTRNQPTMNIPPNASPPGRVKGMALIIALILLTILTILGVASMSSVVMQERMAGNVNLQAIAFQAASAGITEALTYSDQDTWEGACDFGSTTSDEWQSDWFAEVVFPVAGLSDDTRVVFRHKVGCFLPNPIPEDWEELDSYPMELLVLSQGEVQRFSGGSVQEVLSRREVEVKVTPGAGTGDCLFTIGPIAPGGMDSNIGKGKNFIVQGEDPGGCPIQFAESGDHQEFIDNLSKGSSRVGNWRPTEPGITHAPLRSPWSEPLLLARAMNAIKIGIRAYNGWSVGYTSPPEDATLPATNPFAECAGSLWTGNQSSSPQAPVGASRPANQWVHYLAGGLNISGAAAGTPRGLYIIEGNVSIGGNRPYEADLVVLGGHFNANGLGHSESAGLIQLHNLATRYWDAPGNPNNTRRAQPTWCTDDSSCGTALASMEQNTYFNIDGGGTATLTAEQCDLIQTRWQNLNNCLSAMEGMVRNENFAGLGISEFDFHRQYNTGLSGISPSLDFPDFTDEPDTVRMDIPRCGGDAAGAPGILASWREYIDRTRWADDT
jgi:hypothetical protein